MWDVQTGKELKRFEGNSDRIWAITLSPDGKSLFTGSSDATARMWDVQTGKELKKFEGHSDLIRAITASSDGKYLITRDWSRQVLYWNVETGLQLSELPPSASFNENEVIPIDKKDDIHVEIFNNNGVGFTEDDDNPWKLSLYKGTYFGYRDKNILIWTTN